MDYTGQRLQADFELAWEAVTSSFPTMAASYRAANLAVHATSDINDLDIGFLSNWKALRDQTEYIFADGANNLDDTAVAIFQSLNAYREKDTANKETLDDATEELPTEPPEMGQTTIPHSGMYYGGSGYYFDPPVPASDYVSDAPTKAQLEEKAATVEDKLWEAELTEMSWPDSWVMSIPSRDWLLGTADGDLVRELSGGVVSKVKECTKYDPVEFSNAVSALESIGQGEVALFNTFTTEIQNAKDGLDPDVWDSQAAASFRSEFLNAYDDIAESHVRLLGTLAGSLSGYREGLESTHKSMNEAMDAAIEACDAVIETGSGKAAGLLTAVISAVIAVAGTVYTGGTATAIAWSLGGSGFSVAATALTGGGGSRDEIQANVIKAIGDAKEKLNEFDTGVTEKLGADNTAVTNGRHDPKKKIDLPKPDFTYYGAEPF